MSHQSNLIKEDILAYLAEHEKKELLRLLTCGSVDDGKSTLIGRLLHDSKMIYSDQLAAITKDSERIGTTGGQVDLALLVDGLQAEREQGITIDVAYRYFSTKRRKFIIADTPGHEQYTRNMATGASTCDLAIILVDARYGVQTQTRRHSIITNLLGIKHVIIAINKMDLVNYDEGVFKKIKQDYLNFCKDLEDADRQFIPISALHGDNVVKNSKGMSWYQGHALIEILETIVIAKDKNLDTLRLPIQYVNRPDANFRGYCGTIASGILRPGDVVTVLPSKKQTSIASIVCDTGSVTEAFPPMSVTVTLTDEIDVSRGDMLVNDTSATLGKNFTAYLIWMAENPLISNVQYYFKLATQLVTGAISTVDYRLDINHFTKQKANTLQLNEIGQCQIHLNTTLVFDEYKLNKITGAFIVIDRLSNATVGAGMIIKSEAIATKTTVDERKSRYGHRAFSIYLTGEGRKILAEKLDRQLADQGIVCTLLDVLDISKDKTILADIFNQSGIICIATFENKSAQPPKHGICFDCTNKTLTELLTAIKPLLFN